MELFFKPLGTVYGNLGGIVLNHNTDVEEHWLEQLRGFVEDILAEASNRQEQLSGIPFELEQAPTPEDQVHTSAWVDGGSTYLDVSGGTLYVVQAAAGLFRPGQPVTWSERTVSGFTTLARHADRFAGIQRDMLELECILEVLGENPDFVVLDNSLASYATQGVPYSTLSYFSNPDPDESPEYQYFEAFIRFMRRFDVLIQQCQIRNMTLLGAAKDPRSRLFARSLGLEHGINDSSAISMLAGDRTGFTDILEARYLEVPRVKQYLERESILVDSRGKFLTMFGILKPNARVFRVDLLQDQGERVDDIRGFLTSMHDGNGYLLPSHIVHNKATIPSSLSDSLLNLIMSRIARENMAVARAIFGEQRRSSFG